MTPSNFPLNRLGQLINPAGGLKYHFIAHCHRDNLWAPFIEELNQWLLTLKTQEKLLWIGPSAGYCIGEQFLNRFQSIDIIEPDAIARGLLSRKLKKHRHRFLAKKSLHPHHLDEFLSFLESEQQNSFILFSNILGQLPLLFTKELLTISTLHMKKEWQQQLSDFSQKLDRFAWASFHDRFSTTSKLDAFSGFHSPYKKIDRLASSITPADQIRSLRISDHHTDWVAPHLSRQILYWRRTKKHKHIIECVASPLAFDKSLDL